MCISSISGMADDSMASQGVLTTAHRKSLEEDRVWLMLFFLVRGDGIPSDVFSLSSS